MILFLKVLAFVFIIISVVGLLGSIFTLVRFHKKRLFFIGSTISCGFAILFVVFLAWSQHVSDTQAASVKETKEEIKEENKEENKEEKKESTKEETNEDSEAVSDSVESKEVQDQIIADLEEAAEQAEEESSSEDEIKENQDRFFSLLQSNFEDVANVRFDESQKVFYIDSTDEGFAKEVIMMATGVKSLDTWDVLVSEYQKTSLLLKDEVDEGYTISVSNPMNPDNTILMITDGVVVYDAITESQEQ